MGLLVFALAAYGIILTFTIAGIYSDLISVAYGYEKACQQYDQNFKECMEIIHALTTEGDEDGAH